MLNKYLQIIITVGLCGEGKNKGKENGAERKSEGIERMWKK